MIWERRLFIYKPSFLSQPGDGESLVTLTGLVTVALRGPSTSVCATSFSTYKMDNQI